RQDAHRRLRRLLDERLRLVLPAAPEAVRRRAAGAVAAVDQAPVDLGRDQLLSGEDADGIAAEPDEEGADEVVLRRRAQKGRDVHEPVLALVLERERRSNGERLVAELEARAPALVERSALG